MKSIENMNEKVKKRQQNACRTRTAGVKSEAKIIG